MTTAKDRNGIYGPNTHVWTPQDFERIERGAFRHALVRTDVAKEALYDLRHQGIEIVHQLPDHWASDPHDSPTAGFLRLMEALEGRAEKGEPAVPDNEQNLQARLSYWHAEQWTRYYRALWALWKWHDPAQHTPIIYPAVSPNDPVSVLVWASITTYNPEWLWQYGAHCYWQNNDQLQTQLDRLHYIANVAPLPHGAIHVLEYANTDPNVPEEEKARQYVRFLTEVPEEVLDCYLFMLGGTPEWAAYFPSDVVLDALASLPE